eukprot:863997-Rhodomonas_salina.1
MVWVAKRISTSRGTGVPGRVWWGTQLFVKHPYQSLGRGWVPGQAVWDDAEADRQAPDTRCA